jgi:hypothetical protein
MRPKGYPIYIIAHNPNTLKEADEALALGVNALEPDIQYNEYTKDLCISHDAPGKNDDPPTVDAYLEHVKQQLDRYPGLSLIFFDIKLDEPAYNSIPIAEWGTKLHRTANRILGNHDLVMIYSVSKKKQVGIFSKLALSLGPKECIMVDQESDVDEVIAVLQPLIGQGVTRIAYADGSYKYLPDLGVARHVRNAIYRRAQKGLPLFVGTWVLPAKDSIQQYLRMGVDCMIVDNTSIKTALQVIADEEFEGRFHLGDRDDNPFDNGMLSYGVEITTLDRSLAGTDAMVKYTLSGPKNKLGTNIDTEHWSPFKAGSTTKDSLKMHHAGTPLSISLSHNGAGLASGWLPDMVHVYEHSTGLDMYACFGDWISKGEVHTRELGTHRHILTVYTSDIHGAGTDSDILFTIEGSQGSVKRRVNAAACGFFERNNINIVEIPGADIGDVWNIKVETDGSGGSSDWHLDKIELSINGSPSREFIFNEWITHNKPVIK